MVKKVPNEQFFLTLKQKRYKRKKIIPQRVRFSKNADDFKIEKVKFSDRPCFVSTNFLDSINFEPTKLYRLLKKNKIRHEDMPVQLSRRLLRTKKTLVLPAHVNLTLITNSYDVVHSWFLPALGVKIDCVPGRSTHHVFYCDNVGFYYGQCAEICGRYHHHMPIRLCALPFEHFII
jgi:heme/copper-type cytochrome/quinol oxidase subunit 2